MTLVAVVSDYLLHPFYPQFFKARFGVSDPKIVGYYFAAICFMVMISFPFWAYVSKKVSELKILIGTQLIAGILALCCFWTNSYLNFWILSLVMVLFKASYLLVYPYILKIVKKEEHTQTIGVLSVVVHLGGVLGAVLGGLVIDFIHTSYIFLIMAAGDFIQMFMSMYLLKGKKYKTPHVVENHSVVKNHRASKLFIVKIGLITLILYFSDFLIRPFFSKYWEVISIYNSKFITGLVYAIPAVVALLALWFSNKGKSQSFNGVIPCLLIGIVGLLLQGSQLDSVVIGGRIIYGWAVFKGVVLFDTLLFELSTPESYATDYSKVHFFQNLGVLLASFSVGILVDYQGLYIPFTIAGIGFFITLICYVFLFKVKPSSIFKVATN
ncbi:MAG: MFS transporter [Kordia sp.]|nr:MAG: MFS transporter [Kordia sp.]